VRADPDAISSIPVVKYQQKARCQFCLTEAAYSIDPGTVISEAFRVVVFRAQCRALATNLYHSQNPAETIGL
jgi:hypothetical protein